MGCMLDKVTLALAVETNIGQWDWDINTTYPLNENEAKAVQEVIAIFRKSDELKEVLNCGYTGRTEKG